MLDKSSINDYDIPCLVVTLSNSEILFCKDVDGADKTAPSFWLQLIKYCEQEKCGIRNILIRFRSNVVKPFSDSEFQGADSVVFFRKAITELNSGAHIECFCLGAIKNLLGLDKHYDEYFLRTFRLPDLTAIDEERIVVEPGSIYEGLSIGVK